MLSLVKRKLFNLIIIPLIVHNWYQIIIAVLYCKLLPSRVNGAVQHAILRNGPTLQIRMSNTLDLGSLIEVYRSNVYNPASLKLPDHSTIIDIGASNGDFSIFCATKLRAEKVISYEPDQKAFELLINNIRINDVVNKIKPYSLGVSSLKEEIEINGELHKAVPIEEIFRQNELDSCDLLKMDCEGWEYEILLNTSIETLKKVRALAMECHIFNNDDHLKDLDSYLKSVGFNVKTTDITNNICYMYASR